MMQFEMDDKEAALLLNVLENYFQHLEVEINRTHRREFRDALKEREKSLSTVIERLRRLVK